MRHLLDHPVEGRASLQCVRLSRRQHELVAPDPGFSAIALNFLEHDREIGDITGQSRIVLEEQAGDQLAMVLVSDDEMDMPGNAACITGIYREDLELSTIIRIQVSTPAVSIDCLCRK